MGSLGEHVTNLATGDWFCDFCHVKNVNEMWFYPHSAFSIRLSQDHDLPPVFVPASSMAACYECRELIEKDDIQGLIDRALRVKLEKENYKPDLPSSILVTLYSRMFNGFRSHKAGAGVARARYDT